MQGKVKARASKDTEEQGKVQGRVRGMGREGQGQDLDQGWSMARDMVGSREHRG